jgi:hypothetical protein
MDPAIRTLNKLDAYDWNKTDILLVYAGLKPMCDIFVGRGLRRKAKPSTAVRARAARARAVTRALRYFCHDVGLICRRHKSILPWPSIYPRFVIGRTKKDIDRYKKYDKTARRGALSVGRLLGYPETAARAYGKGERFLLPLRGGFHHLPRRVPRKDFMAFADIRLSKAHWRRELKIIERWARTVKEFDPPLYHRTVKGYRAMLAKRRSRKR